MYARDSQNRREREAAFDALRAARAAGKYDAYWTRRKRSSHRPSRFQTHAKRK